MLKFNLIEVITCIFIKGSVLIKVKMVWWNWILVSKTTWLLGQINRVRDIRIGQILIRESLLIPINVANWLIFASNLSINWVKMFWGWIMSSILFSKSVGSSWKGKYKSWFWKFCWNCESVMFSNCHSDSCKTSKLFSYSNFSSTSYSRKEVYEVECWKGGW